MPDSFLEGLGTVLGDVSLFLRPLSQWGNIPSVMAQREKLATDPGVRSYLGQHPFAKGLLVGGGPLPDINPVQQAAQTKASLFNRAAEGDPSLTEEQRRLVGIKPTLEEELAQVVGGGGGGVGAGNMRVKGIGPGGITMERQPPPSPTLNPVQGHPGLNYDPNTGKIIKEPGFKPATVPSGPPAVLEPPKELTDQIGKNGIKGWRFDTKGNRWIPIMGENKAIAAAAKITLQQAYGLAAGYEPDGKPATPERKQMAQAYIDNFLAVKKREKEEAAGAKPPGQQQQRTEISLKSSIGMIATLQKALQNPQVRAALGPEGLGSRLRHPLIAAGFASGNALYDSFAVLSKTMGDMATTAEVAGSGLRSALLWNYLRDNGPTPTDAPEIQDLKLEAMRVAFQHVLDVTLKLQNVPADKMQDVMNSIPDISEAEEQKLFPALGITMPEQTAPGGSTSQTTPTTQPTPSAREQLNDLMNQYQPNAR